MARTRAPDQHAAARAGLSELGAAHAAAAAYVSRWPDHPPDYFVDNTRSRRDQTRRAFDHGTGWAARLISSLETPAHFTLHAEHLDLSQKAAAPALLFDRRNVERWKRAIRDHFTGPCRWKLELGRCGRVHAHVLANLADGPAELHRGGQVVKPCLHYLDAVVGYVTKPPLEYCAEHLALWSEAKRRGRLPRLSGTMNLPNKATWTNPSYLRVYNSQPPTSTPKTAPARSHRTPHHPHRAGRPAPVLRQPRVTWSRRPLVKSTPTRGPPGASIRTYPQPFDQTGETRMSQTTDELQATRTRLAELQALDEQHKAQVRKQAAPYAAEMHDAQADLERLERQELLERTQAQVRGACSRDQGEPNRVKSRRFPGDNRPVTHLERHGASRDHHQVQPAKVL